MTTENLRTANGSQSEFSIDFTLPEFTSEIDVYVVNASTGALDKQTENTDYTIDTTNSKVVFDSAHIPAAGTDNVVIIRNTDVTTAAYKRSFTAGSSIRAQDLNANFTRLFEADEDKVQNADIATSAINTSNISKGAVTGEKIATKTITDTNISNSAEIQASKLKSKDITNTQIADNAAISGSKLAAANLLPEIAALSAICVFVISLLLSLEACISAELLILVSVIVLVAIFSPVTAPLLILLVLIADVAISAFCTLSSSASNNLVKFALRS